MAFKLLVHGLSSDEIDTQVVNIARPGDGFERSRPARSLDYIRALFLFLRSLVRAPDASIYLTVAQSRAGFLRDVAFIGLARLAGRRVVIHVHGGNYDGFYRSQPSILKWVIRRVLSSTSSIIVLAERLRSMFDFDPTLASRIYVVPNGLPEEAPTAHRLSKGSAGTPLRILFLSNLIESKGYLNVIEAIPLIAGEGVEVELDLCGEFRTNPSDDRRIISVDQAREFTNALIRSIGLEGKVNLRGVVRGEEKERVLSEAQVFVLPTQYDAEGQPLAIIEAMAWGLPVVATAYRGIPDLVEDGVTGILIPSNEPVLIARAIRRIAYDPDVLQAMSQASRARFEAHFSSEAHLGAMSAVLLGREPR